MFWDAVLSGLGVLLYWETYVAMLEYFAIYLIPMFGVAMIVEKNESAGGVIGCLSMIFVPFLQIAGILIFIITLSPIIFGLSGDAAWAFPWRLLTTFPWAFVKAVGVLFLAAIALAFIPLLGRLQSIHTLVLGGISLSFVLGLLESVYPGTVSSRIDFIPGFWFSTGLIIIGAVMATAGFFVATLIAVSLEKFGEGIGQLLVFPFAAVFGFIPVFIYGAWLGTQLMR